MSIPQKKIPQTKGKNKILLENSNQEDWEFERELLERELERRKHESKEKRRMRRKMQREKMLANLHQND